MAPHSLLLILLWLGEAQHLAFAILYPYESETREVKSLDGLWTFCITPHDQPQDVGFTEKWYIHEPYLDRMVCKTVLP